jgi:hypothetical protein
MLADAININRAKQASVGCLKKSVFRRLPLPNRGPHRIPQAEQEQAQATHQMVTRTYDGLSSETLVEPTS